MERCLLTSNDPGYDVCHFLGYLGVATPGQLVRFLQRQPNSHYQRMTQAAALETLQDLESQSLILKIPGYQLPKRMNGGVCDFYHLRQAGKQWLQREYPNANEVFRLGLPGSMRTHHFQKSGVRRRPRW